MKLTRTLLLGASVAMCMATAATAQNLRGAGGASPSHPSTYMYERFAEYLAEESGGSMSLTLIGPEVVSLTQVPDALESELINVGNLLPLFFPANFQRTNVAGDMALIGRNSHAMALAMTEFVVNCDPCQEEFRNKGMVFLGAGASDVYVLITTSPVRTADDLQGLRLRSGGAPFARWAENFGATPVSIPVGEQFEGMNQGTIDGSMSSIVDMLSFRLVDVARYVTEVPLGTYHVTSNFTFNQSTWAGLSADERATVARAANRANPTLTDRWGFQLPEAARNAVAAAGIEVITPDNSLLEASNSFSATDAAARISADPLAGDFAAMVAKWTAIVEELGDDPAALAERAMQEIWANVDMTTYGL
ncbi:MAG: TRAP transporter substrate-binding protein DctP [Roseinatronobacter sp.]|jgi:TRAP-type C4-dicarboxylate transport system substrate-binding protein|nr:TRAP transporter substrate-binding protein DctP [Roseinatronobacter sp.]